MNTFFRFLRCTALMVMMMTSIMPARAQFTLTTPNDVTNHTETLYWIESIGAAGFYAIPHTNNSNVSTTNMPNLKALWYFMDAGSENNTQYYYIVNHNTGYYLKHDGTLGNENTIKIASFGSGGDAFKFSIGGSAGEWILYPKNGNGNYWVNKKSGNVKYDKYLKSSNYGSSPDENSKWNFVAENSVTWAHPFNNSTDLVKHYYNIHNATSKGSTYYMSIDEASDPYATVSNLDNSKRMWYFIEADSDNTIPNLKYYYIVNVATDKYLKFTGTANGSEQVSSLQLFEHDGTETGDTEDRFQFMVLNAKGTDYSAYSIMPKLEISYYYNQNTSLSPSGNYSSSLSNDMKIGIYNDRGTDSNYAHWLIEDVVVVSVEAPTITNDNGTISMSTATDGATIYYTTDGNIPDNTSTEYTSPFSLGEATVIRAIAYLGSEFSYVSTYNVPSGGDYSHDYLTFNVRTGGTICWKAVGTNSAKTIEYSKNNGAWTSITSTNAGATINVQDNDIVRFRGSNSAYASDRNVYSGFDGGTATYDISGNIMSLIYGDNFASETTLSGSYNFCSLFKQSKTVSAENLILPATSLTECCYRGMFSKCTTLEVAPALPATTLADYCYYYMFEECEITSAPELPAQTLASNCYGNMFLGCTSLNYIKCLAVNKSASGCLTNWVNNVSSIGTFVKPENVNWGQGVSGIPKGWAVNKLPDPTINCDGEFITISCPISGANIYYRLGQSGNFSLYSVSIAITENTLVEAYAVKDELSSATVCEDCIAIKSYKYAGLEMTPGPLYYGSNGYEIKDGWNYNSYNSVCGKNVGSTYFNFIELGQLFESSVFSTSDGDIENVLDPLDGWRIPTSAEWASIFGTTRSGSTVNGASNKHYAMIQLTDASGLLIFPDGETITGAALANMDNTTSNTGITESQLNNYLSQGCIFLPGNGCYDGSTWDNEHNYYWSSIENDASTGYDLCFGPSAISSVDNKDKETYYFPVYLVKGPADVATQLLRTWTYNNNEVELPYSINAIDGHSSSYSKGTYTFTTDVKIKASQPTYLWFQHADQSADIYVNGTKVETHWGGYNAFFTDITNAVMPGLNNIRVTLNNTTRNTLAPFAGDFNFNATLGEVKLISSPVVPSPDYGYDGFHITSTVTEESATITVKTSVPAEATLTCSIDGTNCNYSSTQTGTGEITFTTTINNPHLWNGTLDPYLYDVTLTIAKDGVVYHTFKRGYGLRFFEYRVDNETPANSRFYLNGSPYLLRGVCMHSDLEGKANAITDEDIDNDFEILKDLGCNFVRLAHYPHPKEVYDHCDKMGIIVQTEVPWVNKAESTLPSAYYTHLEGQYRDMVNQHYNHPSIIFWGLSNETTSDDKYFAKEKINEYISIIKGLDSSRWVGYVMSHSVEDPSGYYDDPDADWFGCNIYVGWYIDKTSNNPTSRLNTRLNKTLARLSKPLAFSEYGGGGTQNCHSDDFLNTTTSGNYERHDIEYQMWLHEGHIAAIKNFPQLLFTSQWQLFDIAVSSRNEGYTVCLDGENASIDDNLRYLNNKGLVERDHKTKKDTYYLYKSWWNQTDKFVHICGKNYEKSTSRVIKCYTNDGSTLRLFVNNEEVATATVINNIATFTARNFNQGDVIRVNGATTNDTFIIAGYSEDYVFTTDGNWNVAANWTPANVPAAGDNVTINAACTIPSTYTAQAYNITIGENGRLTIADGGQLYHNNKGVMSTVQKNITAYTDNKNGWYLIGYSFAENGEVTEMDNLLENNYDLYYYDEPTRYWRNYKNAANSFTELEAARGYLYANDQALTIGLKGTLETGSAVVNLPLDYTDVTEELKGFNLIGNPYAHNVTAFTGTNIADECYRMNGTRNELMVDYISDSNPLTAGEGFFVKATAANASINFNSGAKDEIRKTGRINVEICENNKLIDRLILKHDGKSLEKLTLHENGTKVFAIHDYQEMAVVPIEGNEQTIYFETAKNGFYTITVKPEGMEMSYLHLIDNLTGADVDLLQTPEYTFDAIMTDNANRFKLVFVCGDADDDETFAFINNGNIIITVDVEGATLQVIDVMGRVIVSRDGDISRNVSTSGMAPGTYVLRLIRSDKIRTQKIVIR